MERINLGMDDDLPLVDWQETVDVIESGSPPDPDGHNSRTSWLTTINADGSPHVTAVGALWHDGTFWFQTGTPTRKHQNIVRDPRCSVAMSVRDADVVVEGEARRVTDPEELRQAAAGWAAGGWPAEADPSGEGITAPFNAPSQGPPPWHVFRVEPASATVVLCSEPGGSTRFRF